MERRDSSSTSTEDGEDKNIRRERSPGKRSTKLTRRMEAVRSIQEGSKTPSRQQDRSGSPRRLRAGSSGSFRAGSPMRLRAGSSGDEGSGRMMNPRKTSSVSRRPGPSVSRAGSIYRQRGQPEWSTRTESEDESGSSATVSRRCSDSDSGVNLSPVTNYKGGILPIRTQPSPRPDHQVSNQPGPCQDKPGPGSDKPGPGSDKPGPGSDKVGPCKPDRATSNPRCTESGSFTYSSSVPMAGLPLAGAVFGLCLGGPVGLVAGIKLGGVVAVGGSILGYTGAKVISEQRELRTYMDDHYKNYPEIFVSTPRAEAQRRRRGSVYTPPDTPRFPTSPVRGRGDIRQAPGLGKPPNSPTPLRRTNSVRVPSQKSVLVRQATVSQCSEFKYGKKDRHLPSPRQFRRFQDQTVLERESLASLLDKGRERRDNLDLPRDSSSPEMECVEFHSNSKKKRRKDFGMRTCSLPDVLEEDSLSNKS
ncbi:uncharacterized protein LOC111715128 [Eurytemora carolleeae]|uniref:uncharacterized protein LOC111715128 n=1 Tax=Eurytemora carolleeae TaxID=1294199 RepID=UPI000C77F512|nr:uncharacterized protein LOC111715128 [Eurytemora carolleeae]|eukprot:XP_023346162.1 uncharacterized protein LOC111715128 [Eurytemora affinis]